MLEEFLNMTPGEVQREMMQNTVFHESLIIDLLRRLVQILTMEDNVLFLQSDITICGDIHGQLYDLFKLFDLSGQVPETKYLFLGDYVDRGYQSIQTFVYLAYLKVRFPDRIFLLRGNHESRTVNHAYGFHAECMRSYGHHGICELFNQAFDFLPISAIIDNSIFCVHGGLSPGARCVERIMVIKRNQEISGCSLLADLCWSDPDESATSFVASQRGAGYIFGKPQVSAFLNANKLEMIARSHQLVMDGFQWFFEEKLILVWSAPNYCYTSGNRASVMKVAAGQRPAFILFDADEKSDEKPADEIHWIEYFA
jgi:diadenosine tetraphosphatase ApaH/serine/threonine PP2A family protein phosphatase